jgi:hypothetical protein
LSEQNKPKNNTNPFLDAYFKLPQETFEFFVRSTDVCMKMYETWTETSDMILNKKLDQKELASAWTKNFEEIYKDVFETLFRPMHMTAGKLFMEPLTPFLDFTKPPSLMGAFANQYFWLKPFERMTACCPKEVPQLLSKVVDAYSDFFVSWREYNSTLHKAWLEALDKLAKEFVEKTIDMQNDSNKPAEFWDFYNLWLETYQKTYTDLLILPEIVSLQTRLSSSLMDIIKNYRELFEGIIGNFPAFPLSTKSEIDEVYKRIHLIGRDIDEIKKNLKKQNSLTTGKKE